MLNKYVDSHDTHISDNSGAVTAVVVVGGIVAVVIALGMALTAIAAMIWAVVAGLIGVAIVAGAVLVNRDIQKTRQAAHYREVEIAARIAGGFPLDAPYYGRGVVDATPVRALPAGQARVNGLPQEESASDARRR
jgi:hypothetical protein